MPSPNVRGPLSVLQVLKMDYGVLVLVLGGPLSVMKVPSTSFSRFNVQGNFLLLCVHPQIWSATHMRFFESATIRISKKNTSQTSWRNGTTLILSATSGAVKHILPIASMYGIFAYIYHKHQPNVGKYTIYGSYGLYIYINIYI